MEYMEQQMQQQIEAGISEADRCYTRIAELEEQNAALATMHVDNVRHIWESRNCGSCEELAEKHDSLMATVAVLREYIERGAPINTNPEKCERVKILAATPIQHLAEIRADAGRAGVVYGVVSLKKAQLLGVKFNTDNCAIQYAEIIRQANI